MPFLPKAQTAKGLLFSFISLFASVMIDYFTVGHQLFSVPAFSGSELVLLSVTSFIVTTCTAQLVFAVLSSIQTGVVATILFESIPFSKGVAQQCYDTLTQNGKPIHAPTLLLNICICMFISTFLFAILSLLIYIFKIGHFFKDIPLPPVLGAMTAIGLKIIFYSSFDFSSGSLLDSIISFAVLLIMAFAILFVEIYFPTFPFLVPTATAIIILGFNVIYRFILNKTDADLRDAKYIFSLNEAEYPFSQIMGAFRGSSVVAGCITANLGRIGSVVIFNMLFLNINIPVYIQETSSFVDYDTEWLTQGVSNLVTAFTGFPSYFTGSYSIMFFKVGGTTRAASIFAAFAPIILELISPWIRSYIPRILSSTIMTYVGLSFIYGYFIRILGAVSLIDILIMIITVVATALIGQFSGFFLGMVISLLITMGYYGLAVKKQKTRDISKHHLDTSVSATVEVPYVLCFATVSRFQKETDAAGSNFIVDLTDCPYIDMSGNMALLRIAEQGCKVRILGRPKNLYWRAIIAYSNMEMLDVAS